jgi:hypothetical protein
VNLFKQFTIVFEEFLCDCFDAESAFKVHECRMGIGVLEQI